MNDTAANKPAPETIWTYSEVETALCLYEAMSDVMSNENDANDEELAQLKSQIAKAWDNNGGFGMKYIAAGLAHAVTSLWVTLDEGKDLTDGIVFDWEFIPEILGQILWDEIDHNQVAKLKPDTLATMTAWRDELQKRNAEGLARQLAKAEGLESYLRRARNAAGRIWGYEGLADDAPDQIQIGFINGEDVAELVEKIGKRLGLSEPDPIQQQNLNKIYLIVNG